MTHECEKFDEWTNSNDEYLYYDSKLNKWRGDGYMPNEEFIFNFCPFCGKELNK